MTTGLLLLGRIAIRLHYLTEEDLQQALQLQRQQKAEGKVARLGELLLDNDFLTHPQLAEIMNAQRMINQRTKDRCFGEVAVANGMLTKQQLMAALVSQKQHFQHDHDIDPVADILLEQGLLTTEQRDAILVAQQRIKAAELHGEAAVGSALNPAAVRVESSSDHIKALLFCSTGLAHNEALTQIHNLLKQQGIVQGIKDDTEILSFIQHPSDDGFVIAEGVSPIPGEDASITYAFETAPLRSGAVAQDGTIDFKDRGEIPQVEEGVVIATKRAATDGTAGIDLYGHPIPAPPSRDIKLIGAAGVKISTDRLSATTTTSGTPCLTKAGALTILPTLQIKGHVGYKSGHVDFHGDIRVSEGIDDGFKVTGGRLEVMEIGAAEINISGDVVVRGGIIGAHIKVGGSLQAHYIHKSYLEVSGDVVIKKEIIESELLIGESLLIERGNILSSTIKSQGDITAMDIGSPAGVHARLSLGSAAQVDAEISAKQQLITQYQHQLEQHRQRLLGIEQEYTDANDLIGKMAQVQDQGQTQLRKLTQHLESRKGGTVANQLTQQINHLNKTIADAETTLSQLFNQQDSLDSERQEIASNSHQMNQLIECWHDEIDNLTQQRDQGSEREPQLRVNGTIYPQNHLTFPHCEVEIKNSLKRTLIHQRSTVNQKQQLQWQVVTESLDPAKKRRR